MSSQSQPENKPLFLQPGGQIVRFEKSHANDPHVIEMGRRAEETLKRVGFPKELLEIRAERINKTSK